MNETTEQKVNVLLRHMTKTMLARTLEIGRNNLYNLIETNKWKRYQIKKIDYIYAEICKVTGDIKDIYIEDDTFIITVKKSSQIHYLNMDVKIKY